MFNQRRQAGILLAHQIIEFLDEHPELKTSQSLILALPLGGVTIGEEIALSLNCPLDILVTKSIRSPFELGLNIGAISADGTSIVGQEVAESSYLSHSYLNAEKGRLLKQAKECEATWRRQAGTHGSWNFDDKVVFVVDDGAATAMMALVAARRLRSYNIQKLLFATPVLSHRAHNLLLNEYEHVFALKTVNEIDTIRNFYIDEQALQESEMINILTKVRDARIANCVRPCIECQ